MDEVKKTFKLTEESCAKNPDMVGFFIEELTEAIANGAIHPDVVEIIDDKYQDIFTSTFVEFMDDDESQ
eukprot:CAMPEP_0119524876 /NCGR_PEP_ID=MMETSP1344-20130328/39750_1 /TAXON_ID=236787 /ORGANISM="Florenciella parvula, Strain CCMP2471" /LENGTH=68 /DNA_ID=CAMNT_0007563497 /DNA_START=1 /DNA_END=204 /DNA_ORIENTATION=-